MLIFQAEKLWKDSTTKKSSGECIPGKSIEIIHAEASRKNTVFHRKIGVPKPWYIRLSNNNTVSINRLLTALLKIHTRSSLSVTLYSKEHQRFHWFYVLFCLTEIALNVDYACSLLTKASRIVCCTYKILFQLLLFQNFLEFYSFRIYRG